MAFAYSQHALDMITERDLRREWIERTILRPTRTEPDPKHTDRIRAFRAVPERDGRVLRVVYVEQSTSYRVITAFLDRSEG